MPFALPAPETLAARAETHRSYAHACGNAGNLRSDFNHITTELVTEDGAFLSLSLVNVKVGTAYTACLDL
jgi:hypothetical protein